jgi:hypothetical protein
MHVRARQRLRGRAKINGAPIREVRGRLVAALVGWIKHKKLLPTLLVPMRRGVMVLAAQIVRVLARFGLDVTFTLRLKVGSIFPEIWWNFRKCC